MSVNPKPSRSLAGIAGIVAVATLVSKIFGLFREQAIAAAFGVGPVVNAYAGDERDRKSPKDHADEDLAKRPTQDRPCRARPMPSTHVQAPS